MNTPSEEQIAKLPKWAREHIKSLNRKVQNVRYEFDKIVQSTKSNINSRVTRGSLMNNYSLPETDNYRFRMKNGCRISVRIDDDHDGILYVSAEEGFIAVHPRSSNSFLLSAKRETY